MKVKVSIIVPVYNAETYIEKCIDSIRNQSLKELEIILIDDGSTDKCPQILDRYAHKDSRIVVIHKKNGGPAAARNYGIKIAKGEYLGFVDSDDYIEPMMYEKLFNLAITDNIEVAMCGYNDINMINNTSDIIRANIEFNKVHNKKYIRNNIISTFTESFNYGYFSLWNKIYNRHWIEKICVRIDESRDHGEDWWFNINVFMKMNSFICTEEPLYNYMHVNSNSLMIKYREELFDLFLDGRLKILSIIPEELINYDSLNRNFVYEFSAYILRTNKEVNDKNKKKVLIRNVIENSEVIACCRKAKGLPLYYKITSFLIRSRMKRLAMILYKVLSFAV